MAHWSLQAVIVNTSSQFGRTTVSPLVCCGTVTSS
jgi:hypothetical protein